MDLVEQFHNFGLTNIHTFGHNISFIRLISLMLNYAKTRLFMYIPEQYVKDLTLKSQKNTDSFVGSMMVSPMQKVDTTPKPTHTRTVTSSIKQ